MVNDPERRVLIRFAPVNAVDAELSTSRRQDAVASSTGDVE